MDASQRDELAQRTRARLDRVSDIPTLPPVLLRVWDLAARPDTTADQLGRVLETDTGLTAALLRLANSAYFGIPNRVSTVSHAVVVLGFETVKGLATSASVFRSLDVTRANAIDGRAFLRHALVTAMVARRIVAESSPQEAGVAFTAGILHDVGRLVIAEHLREGYARVVEQEEEGTVAELAEQEALGMTHAEVGHWFARNWRFPDNLAEAILCHHAPGEAKANPRLAAAVHLADVIAHRCGAGGSGRRTAPAPRRSGLGILGLSEEDLEAWVVRASEQEGRTGPEPGVVLEA